MLIACFPALASSLEAKQLSSLFTAECHLLFDWWNHDHLSRLN